MYVGLRTSIQTTPRRILPKGKGEARNGKHGNINHARAEDKVGNVEGWTRLADAEVDV